jgi:dTDP-3-amino-2,3,6-trideoxy-4-keto-D-glucose/dTDP-3-amino-3,4,6-trideoxy-alpha-D-glucose/dTDP-2,6-dideoxy-D-kanosamine transaminase
MLPVNDLRRRTAALRPIIEKAIGRVIDRGWFILGPEVEGFEAEFAAWCGAAHCVAVGNGTDALELALKAVGVRPGSRVATVANAGFYSTTAILRCGAVPVWIDIDRASMNMSPERLADVKVDAVVVTHLYGRMADMPAILTAAGAVPVIEDCAQAHGASWHGRRAGTWGAAGTFSFYPTKNLGALGDGGAVVTNDMDTAGRLRALRQYGWTAKYTSSVEGGRNSRLDELQAAILRAQLPLLDGWNERRREIAAAYGGGRGGESDVVHLYVVRSRERDRFRAALKDRGIATDVHYPIADYRQASVGETNVTLPETERCCTELVTLPCFPEMTSEEIAAVSSALAETRALWNES